MKLVFSPEFLASLEDIGDYIAQDSPYHAARFISAIREKCRLFQSMPKAGRARPELGEGLRSHAHGTYVIIYRLRTDAVEIIDILHGARDIGKFFKP